MFISSELFTLAVVTLSYPLILLWVFSLLQRPNPEKEGRQEILNKIEAQVRVEIAATLKKTEKILAESLYQLSATIKGDYEKNRRELKTATDNYLDKTKIALSGAVENAEKRVNDKLTEELEAALTELKNYKEGRLKRIDDEIATVVEKTIYLTLGKSFSLKDHTDIIYESLAEAKEEGFFGKNAD